MKRLRLVTTGEILLKKPMDEWAEITVQQVIDAIVPPASPPRDGDKEYKDLIRLSFMAGWQSALTIQERREIARKARAN